MSVAQTDYAASYRIAQSVLRVNKAVLIALVFGVFLSFASPYFLQSQNLLDLLQQIVAMLVVALGYTLVIGAREIDLSIGGIVGLVGMVMGKLMTDAGVPWFVAVVGGVALAAACGAFNAVIISWFRLPSFIVTLATNALFTGLIYVISNLVPVSDLPSAFVNIGNGSVAGIPIAVVIALPVAVAFYVLVKASVFGQHVIALGEDPEAVRTAGVSVNRIRLKVFVLGGACCGLASVLLTARSASAQIGAGSDLLLLVIAAVVIGGTPLLGGRADIVGTVFGCLTIGMISNGLNLLGVSANYQTLTQGALILFALMVDVESAKLLLAMARRHAGRAP
jgi:ribose/xylose/arabinose/galactoside ABC-type transport system permease subunit